MAANKGINWDDQPLGKMPDARLARKLGVGQTTVCEARKRRGIPVYRGGRQRPGDATPAHPPASCDEFVRSFTARLWTADDAAAVFGGAPSTMHDMAAAKVDSSIPYRLAFDAAGIALLEDLYCVRFDVAVDGDDDAIDVGGVPFIRTSSGGVDEASGEWMIRDDAAAAIGVTRDALRAMHRRGEIVRRGRGRGRASSVMFFVPDSMRTQATPAGSVGSTSAHSADDRIDEIHDMLTRLCASLGV